MENSNQNSARLQQLFDRYYAGTASTEEMNELAVLVNEAGNDSLLPALKQAWDQEEGEPLFTAGQSDAVFNSIVQQGPAKKARIRSLLWWAAAAIIIISIAAYWLLLPPQNKKIPQQAQKTTPAPQDIAPGKDGAILTLSDGRKIILDDAHNGNIASEGNTHVVKRNGQLEYDASHSASAGILFNTMSTPRGRQYSVLLADGSKVWLNASSSITYPTVFAGKERRVQITGEVYFEVAHNAAKPFRVEMPNKQNVEVLGTRFNINSYADEEEVKTTLLQGSVKIASAYAKATADKSTILKPGQQASISQNAKLTIHAADTSAVMAWRNGYFSFNNTDLKTVMRQLARWYDVNVVYEGNIDDIRFGGEIGRSLSLSQVLGILDDTRIHYSIEGKKLLIKP